MVVLIGHCFRLFNCAALRNSIKTRSLLSQQDLVCITVDVCFLYFVGFHVLNLFGSNPSICQLLFGHESIAVLYKDQTLIFSLQ